ncbi:hypothetical protein M1L60_32915 [Actinoplanes sp. TRM 88003]|uniref:Uncharacterized protein n=1 Tax=Paractinoplanes aksuensis TaxID=2939490 RepID=A0ABT1DX07_9ACTN|nr:hypothetical protein [Actinoplanes aksuensis]MCO8275394.1 hypothetical protein [Actinoplanes aksuensis]
MPRSRPHGGGNGGDPPPPRRPRPGATGGDPDNIAAAQARTQNRSEDGRLGRGTARPGSGSSADSSSGPPWPTADGVAGSARGRDLNPPHQRHTIAGSRSGMIDQENTVYLRGYESVAATDVQAIAAGEGTWNPTSQRYEINGRSYGVEPSGRVFPDSGDGMVKLDRNEYAALKEIARAGGDASAAPQLTRNPRFTANPEAVAKAQAIYDGTYEP